MDSTLPQLKGYLAAVQRLERERDQRLLLLLRAAQADQAGFDQVWQALED